MATHEFLLREKAIDFADHARATGYIAVLTAKKQKQDGRKKTYCVYVYRA